MLRWFWRLLFPRKFNWYYPEPQPNGSRLTICDDGEKVRYNGTTYNGTT